MRLDDILPGTITSPLVDHDIEQFEDDPLEFIRLDLSIPSTSASTIGGTSGEVVTRRQAAADVLKALVAGGLEEETTGVVSLLIQKRLESYSSNPRENWRLKDIAVYLLGAVATRGSTVAVRLLLVILSTITHSRHFLSLARSNFHQFAHQCCRILLEPRVPGPAGP